MKRTLTILAVLAAVSFGFTSCNKDDEKEDESMSLKDYVGTWKDSDVTLKIEENGSFTSTVGNVMFKGVCSLTAGKMKFTPEGEEAYEVEPKLLGDNTALVFIDGDSKQRGFQLFFKDGVTVKSGKLGNGRWDAPHDGVKPADENSVYNDYWISLIVDNNVADLYVLAWGFHVRGTYTHENGSFKYDSPAFWQGIYRYGDSFGWSAYGAPGSYDPEVHGQYVDDGVANMNPQTFQLKQPWYFEQGDPMHNYAPVSNIRLVVSDDGKEAYCSTAGLTFWMYKR